MANTTNAVRNPENTLSFWRPIASTHESQPARHVVPSPQHIVPPSVTLQIRDVKPDILHSSNDVAGFIEALLSAVGDYQGLAEPAQILLQSLQVQPT